MSIRPDKRNIPTVADAVDRFLIVNCSYKAFRDLESLLRGAKGRVVGKAAAGCSLAHSQLGGLRMHRLQTHDVAAWFELRHDGLAQNTLAVSIALASGLLVRLRPTAS